MIYEYAMAKIAIQMDEVIIAVVATIDARDFMSLYQSNANSEPQR